MKKFVGYCNQMWSNKSVRNKLLWTIGLLVIYRMLVVIPVPFVDVAALLAQVGSSDPSGSGLGFFTMLFGGSLESFSIIAVGLSPFINASIIMQLLAVVVPKLEELQELGEQGTKQIQQYVRYATFPLAFLQSIGMVYFINSILGGVIDISSFSTVLTAAFVLSVGSMVILYIGDLITEKGISNGVSMLIFASIVAGMTSQIYGSVIAAETQVNILAVILFMFVIIGALVVASIFLLKSIKNIPIVYARQGKVEQTSSLPIPLNPVGMIPIIFAIAFTTFPYLLAQIILRIGTMNATVMEMARWVDTNLNIYTTQQPSIIAIVIYFAMIVIFTFFYTLIQFNPDKISDMIQKKGGFIPGIRPGEETAKYIHKTLMHLALRGGMGLGVLGIYSYVLYYIPIIRDIALSLGGIPVVVTGSGIIIIVGVVQDLISKTDTELLMTKYDKL